MATGTANFPNRGSAARSPLAERLFEIPDVAGVFLGTLIGVLPGIGPATAMALLLPTTVGASPESGIILLAGIYYGSMYGGSTTSILINVPGEAASVVTCLDGHQMALAGRAGPALALAAAGSAR